MKPLSTTRLTTVKRVLIWVCLMPFLRLLAAAWTDSFGPDPVADITHTTGIWSLRLLLVMLALTPLKKFTGWNWLVCLRRTVALCAFYYACLHVLSYLVFEQYFDWPEIVKDISKRPFITAGFVSFILMLPLAATSTNAMVRRIGGRNWRKLHRLAYLVAAGAVFHYLWLVKQDITRPALYALILCALLCARMIGRPLQRVLSRLIEKPGMDASMPGQSKP